MRYAKGKDGKFKGAISDGATSAPTPSTVPAAAASASAGAAVPDSPAIDATYEQFRTAGPATPADGHSSVAADLSPDVPTNTYPARYAAYEAASATYEAAQALADQTRGAAGGQAIPAGQCATCRHRDHDGKTCSTTVQIMSDIWDSCGCAQPVAPTPEQVTAAEAASTAHQHLMAMYEAQDTAQEYRAGDVITVTRGRKVPQGSTGSVLRTYNGDYGLRVLFRDEAGEDTWIAASNIDRFLA